VICGWASRSDAEADAYLVADNRLTPSWAAGTTANSHALLSAVGEVDPDLVAIAGFDAAEIDKLLTSSVSGDLSGPSEFPSYDESISTEHECPSCGYKWSGGK
jgi:hypothetical protein